MECELRSVTGNLNDVINVCALPVNKLNLSLPTSGMSVRQIINDATI